MRVPVALLILASVLVTVPQALVDDTLVTLGAGGLIPLKTSKIAMEVEDLQIPIHQNHGEIQVSKHDRSRH